MRRRRLFLGMGAIASVLPRIVDAQDKPRRLAILTAVETADRAAGEGRWVAFFDELRRLGYEHGRNLTIEWRSAAGIAPNDAEIVREIVASKPDLIFVVDL